MNLSHRSQIHLMKYLGITYEGSEVSDPEILSRVPKAYQHLLNQTNGVVLFDGGLHIRGAVLSPAWHSLREIWFGDFALYKLFSVLDESDVPFAQDCLGDQYVLRHEIVHQLSAETGDLENLDIDFETFIESAQKSPVEFLSLQPLMQFHDEGGRLEPGQLLNAYPPFCTNESANGVSLRAVPMFERISFLADFARQIAGVPDGAKIGIKASE